MLKNGQTYFKNVAVTEFSRVNCPNNFFWKDWLPLPPFGSPPEPRKLIAPF